MCPGDRQGLMPRSHTSIVWLRDELWSFGVTCFSVSVPCTILYWRTWVCYDAHNTSTRQHSHRVRRADSSAVHSVAPGYAHGCTGVPHIIRNPRTPSPTVWCKQEQTSSSAMLVRQFAANPIKITHMLGATQPRLRQAHGAPGAAFAGKTAVLTLRASMASNTTRH